MTMAAGCDMSGTKYTLVIGDKNFSSWSLRPWLAMQQCRIPFFEEHIRLRQPESKAAILRHSPSGKVPALQLDGLVICDSLAILEFIAERHPEHGLWPRDQEARALARSVSAEMHSGFVTLRNEMSMDLLARLPTPPIGEALESDITRIVAIWRDCRLRMAVPGRSVRRLLQCRRHVRTRGNALSHLWRGPRPLRRRRPRCRVCPHHPRFARDGRMGGGRRGRSERMRGPRCLIQLSRVRILDRPISVIALSSPIFPAATHLRAATRVGDLMRVPWSA